MNVLQCYFENQPEFQKKKEEHSEIYKQIDVYDIININEVPDDYIIEFYCEYKYLNDKGKEQVAKTFHRRNVLDLFSILENCISPIKVSYSHGEGAYEYDTFNDACDPINKYEFSKQQIEYIRQKRKKILCNPLLQAVINRFASIPEDKIKEYEMDCNNLLLNAIYCPESPNKNNFMLEIIKLCKSIEPRLILYSAEEDINYKVFNAMVKKVFKDTLSNLLNEKGETRLYIIQVNPTDNNEKYDINDITVVAPLIFTAVVDRIISPEDRYKLVKKLINNGVNVNVKFKGYSPLFMAEYTYTAPDPRYKGEDYGKMIIDLLKENGAK